MNVETYQEALEHSPVQVSATRGLYCRGAIIAAGFYLLLTLVLLASILRATHGTLVYALDDPYIHMAIAKNLVLHGVYGVTSHGFTPASSSILWPFVLAVVYKLIGTSVVAPFVLQILIAIGIIWLAWHILKKAGVNSSAYATCALCALVLFVPMAPLTFVAMEHLLHALATLLLGMVAVDHLQNHRTNLLPVLCCAAAVSLVRYEGAFLVASVALLFLLERRILDAVLVGVVGALPIVSWGLYSLLRGGMFLPNSILIKKQPVGIDSLARLLRLATDCPELFVLALAALLLLVFVGNMEIRNRRFLELFLFSTFFHALFASYGWFFRYEAYLICFGWVAVAAAAWKMLSNLQDRRVTVLALLVLCFPLLHRGLTAIQQTPQASAHVYHQQYQMARFIRTYYPSSRIEINDIGAICFYSDPYITDLAGLGDTDIARVRTFPGQIESLRVLGSRSAPEIALVYASWYGFDKNPPRGWVKAGTWDDPEPVILGQNVVTFYGVGPENADRLRSNLAAFHSELPEELAAYSTP